MGAYFRLRPKCRRIVKKAKKPPNPKAVGKASFSKPWTKITPSASCSVGGSSSSSSALPAGDRAAPSHGAAPPGLSTAALRKARLTQRRGAVVRGFLEGCPTARLPPGPVDRVEVMRWLEDTLHDQLTSEQHEAMGKIFREGLFVTTDYSGSGQPEHALKRMYEWAQTKYSRVHMHLARSSDNNVHCRQCLLAYEFPFNPFTHMLHDHCVMGDIVHRLPEVVRLQIQDIIAVARNLLEKKLKKCKKTEDIRKAKVEGQNVFLDLLGDYIREAPCDHKRTAFCFAHNKECMVEGEHHPLLGAALYGENGKESDLPKTLHDVIRIGIAGVTCVDWSARGKRAGSLGGGSEAFAAWIYEQWNSRNDTIIVECTRYFRHSDIEVLLRGRYQLWQVVFSPGQIGIPSERHRKCMILLRTSGALQWKHGCEFNQANFLKQFGRIMNTNGHIYLNDTPVDTVRNTRDAYAAKLNMPNRDPEGKSWHWKNLLTNASAKRLAEYEAIMEATTLGADTEVFFDINQNFAFGGITPNVPALTRANRPWSYPSQRPMLVSERLEAMGFPVIHCEETLGLEMPFKKAYWTLPSRALMEIAGNAMHLSAIGSVLIYLFTNTDVVEEID